MCSISFSSINRLLNYNQIITCDKSSYNHCEKVFDFKNKFHNHIRSHEYQKLLFNKSNVVIKIILIKLFISEKNATSDENIAKKRITHLITTFFFVIKSIAIHKIDLTPLSTSKTIFNNLSKTSAISFSTYQAISPSSLIYKSYKKSYFTIADLYIRYALLNKPSFTITRIIIVFPIIFI